MTDAKPQQPSYLSAPLARHKTQMVKIGHVTMGGEQPVVVQSMTNTNTADVENTVSQIIALSEAGSELVRVTIDRDEAALALPVIKEKLLQKNISTPLIGDFHYIGHKLLSDYPACAEALDKYRINPGNVGFKNKKDKQFSQIIEIALHYNKPIRIGVNWGSLDQELLSYLMEKNAQKGSPLSAREVMHETITQSALLSAAQAESLGMTRDKIVLSAKVSQVQDLVLIYTRLAQACDYALHLGLTEAGMGSKGIVASAASMGILLQQGIGDTIRISLTPPPGGDRSQEVIVAQELLQVMGLRQFSPTVSACPGCGRTSSSFFQELAQKIKQDITQNMPQWRRCYPGVEALHIAVMGCIVNGPGESKFADIGISLPGNGEAPSAPVFIEGQKFTTLRGEHIAEEFQAIIQDYIEKRFGNGKGSYSH